MVGRSALTLRALCDSSTGAILAAATTSLPEETGGVRNWDYRYCWLRDGALTAHALVSLGSSAEAAAYLGWLHTVLSALPGPERLRPVYAADGSTLGPEAVIETLPGYAGSRPVRVGNLAGQQVQLDVFGPVTELIGALASHRGYLDDASWQLLQAMCEAVTLRWHEPDHGIWEDRQAPRHHVYSKVMCWLAVDRALRLGLVYGRPVSPTSSIAAGTNRSRHSPRPTTAPISTPPASTSACPGCSIRPTPASRPRSQQSKRGSAPAPPSIATGATTASREPRQDSTCAPLG
jgi:GH15 family glucan-1,4-alpha-glucosidase